MKGNFTIHQRFLLACVGMLLTSTSTAAPRDIQLRSVDFETQVLELFNFGSTAQSLTGWRFCTHDENQTRRYSSISGLSGQSINPGEALFIHFANDASQPNELNASQLGPFAAPFDQGPAYSVGLFVNSAFSIGSQLADHMQWSIDGANNTIADERSDEAVSGGVWTAIDAWIPVTSTTKRIQLTDLTGGILHGPDNYNVIEDIVLGDVSGDGTVGPEDYDLWKISFGTADVSADLNEDGLVNAADYTVWRDNYTAGSLGNGALMAVPEPASIVVVLAAHALLGGRRKQVARHHRRTFE